MTTIAVDFDGVIHRYSRGWQDGSIYDPPHDGALDGLRALMRDYAVFIFTSRNSAQVAGWLHAYGFTVTIDDSKQVPWNGAFWKTRDVLLVTNRKLGAAAYLDDRAVRFTSWSQALADLKAALGEEPRRKAAGDLVREILEAVCQRDGRCLESDADPGEPARNYELALRLGIGHVLGLGDDGLEAGEGALDAWVIFDGCAWCPVCNEPVPIATPSISNGLRAARAHQCSGAWGKRGGA